MNVPIAIIGSGPASLTASIYLVLAGYHVTIFTGYNIGGLLNTTDIVNNYPGFYGIKGRDLMQNMYNQLKSVINDMPQTKSLIIEEDVISAELQNNKKILKTHNKEYVFDYVIIGTGSNPKHLEVDGENLVGVSYCAICDGFLYNNKKVVVIGGGETALQEAAYLSKIADKVYLIHRRDTFRSHTQNNMDEVSQNPKIELILNTVVDKFLPKNQLKTSKKHKLNEQNSKELGGIEIRNLKNNTKKILEIDGAFIAIGHLPNTKFINGPDKNEHGYLIVDINYQTSIKGVYGVGDVIVYPGFRAAQAVIAAAEGCTAALSIVKELTGKK